MRQEVWEEFTEPPIAPQGTLWFKERPKWQTRVRMRLTEIVILGCVKRLPKGIVKFVHSDWLNNARNYKELRIDWSRPYMFTGEVWWRPIWRDYERFEIKEVYPPGSSSILFTIAGIKQYRENDNHIWFDRKEWQSAVLADLERRNPIYRLRCRLAEFLALMCAWKKAKGNDHDRA